MKTKKMLTNQQGFTLIEIIAVLIILGILAAVAVPKYFDLTGEAEEKAVEAQAANIRAASVMNFAKYKLGSNTYESIGSCTEATNLVEDWDGNKFGIDSGTPAASFTLMLTTGGSTTTSCSVGIVD